MDLFDDNGNQSLSYDELRDLFSECGIEMEDEEFASLYLMMDKDGNKEVDMKEVRKEGGGAWFLLRRDFMNRHIGFETARRARQIPGDDAPHPTYA